ncbi:C2 domain-containing protein [Artemisia annua]|uniref:C2 domain-containing protein n=1 Tax=Artemisia annua TaxID=35608 RepID=A0A2U1PEB4_ARTAN|nr:C2 domain-containing protein [Artemisia annua]
MDITVVSASGLKNVNLFMRMGVYVDVTLINGDSTTKQKTYVSKGNKNPRWNHRIKFSINEAFIQNSTLIFILHSRRLLGDRIIGEVSIPIHELLDNVLGSESEEHIVEYQVRSIRGKSRGTLTFSHKFTDNMNKKMDNNINNGNCQMLVNTNYPAGNLYAIQQQGVSCYPRAPYPPQGLSSYAGQPQYGGGYVVPATLLTPTYGVSLG